MSRIDTAQEPVAIATLTALEGVPGPVRDLAIDAQGTVWLATDEGLFRLDARGRSNSGTSPVVEGRLIRVSGNNQSALPGQELQAPLVVRLEDQFGQPVANAPLRAQVLRGEAAFVSGATTVTDAEGEAQFRVQVGDRQDDVLVEVSALERAVQPVKFFATIGSVDAFNRPTDITVSDAAQLVFIADLDAGVPIVDVHNPAQPVLLHAERPLNLLYVEGHVEVRGARLYVSSQAPVGLYIVDISRAHAADFTIPTQNRVTPDAVRGAVVFPDNAQGFVHDMALGTGAVYMVQTGQAVEDMGRLQVIDIRDDTHPQLVTSLPLPTHDTSGVAVLGDVAYVTS